MNSIEQIRKEALRVWGEMGQRQKLAVGLLVMGSVVALALLGLWASRPEYTTVYTGLSEEDAASIVDVLQKLGVPYQLAGNGTTIRVSSKEVYNVRLEVAREGLPSGGIVGFELFDQGGLTALGMSEFTQRINYQRALEGELARTISALDGVQQARVHLVIPEKALFTENQSKPTASVVLALRPGRTLSEDRIWGISNLVASSVEGLEPDHVTIVDVNGRVLAEGTDGQSAGKSGPRLSAAQLNVQQEVERHLENGLQQKLNTALGPNKAVVMVNAELNWAEIETTSEIFEPEGSGQAGVVRSQQQSIEATGAITVAGGVPGVDANVVPIYQSVITGTQEGGVVRHDTTVNYEVSKTVMRTVNTPGNIRRLSVAVLLDSNDPDLVAQQPAIEQMAQAAVGYNPDRGDVVTIDLVPFDDHLAEQARALEEAERWALYMSLARLAAPILGLGILLFFVRRTFSSLEERMIVDLGPAPLLQLEGPTDKADIPEMGVGEPGSLLAALDQPMDEVEDMALDLEDIRRRKQLTQVAEEHPDAVARVVQRWLLEEG
jgi:flagellar M-ring protein FliF